MNKKLNLIENDRQLELLEKYYNVDRENKTIYLNLYFDTVSEVLEKNIGNNKIYRLKNDVLELINEAILNTPPIYKIELNLKIDDYEGYDPHKVIEAFNDTLELNQYKARRNRTFKELSSSILILVGILLLFLMAIGKNYDWFGGGVKEDIIVEVIDITAWVFVWEAVTLIFLQINSQTKFTISVKKRVKKISMLDKENNILATESGDDIFGKWEDESRLKRIGKYLILISSIAFVVLGVYKTYLSFTSSDSDLPTYVTIIVTIVDLIIDIFACIGGIFVFLNKNNKLTKFVGVYSFVLLTLFLITLIISIIDNDVKLIIGNSASFLFSLFYIAGYFINKYRK